MENGSAGAMGQGKLPRCAWSYVVRDDTGDFRTKRLDADCRGVRRRRQKKSKVRSIVTHSLAISDLLERGRRLPKFAKSFYFAGQQRSLARIW